MLPIKVILCPVDFSPPSRAALAAAVELAGHFSAELLLLHVMPPVPVLPAGQAGGAAFDLASYQAELRSGSQQALEELAAEVVGTDIPHRPVLAEGEPAQGIARAADEHGADLIVIATHGHTGWRRFMVGSVTEKLVRIAARPVLTVHSPPEE